MANQQTLQDLAKQVDTYINPNTLGAFSYEVCMRVIQDKAFVKSVAKYIMRIFIHCQERHGYPDRDYNLLALFMCPMICTFPHEYETDESTLEIFQAVVDSGRRYSAKLVEVTRFFLVENAVEFEDIPGAATEGLMELVADFNDKHATWKNLTESNEAGKIFDLVRRLEETTVMHNHPGITSRAHSAVEKLRARTLVIFGREQWEALNTKVINSLKKAAIDAHNTKRNTQDQEMRMMFALIVYRACTRIQHYSDSETLQAFMDQHLAE